MIYENAQKTRYIGSTNRIGHGNPASLTALEILARNSDRKFCSVEIQNAAVGAQLFHTAMSKVAYIRERYTNNSEDLRKSFVSMIFARLCFVEFALRLQQQMEEELAQPLHWLAVQEHPVLGSTRRILELLQIENISLHVPDVLPKESARLAIENSKKRGYLSDFWVWNTVAYRSLHSSGYSVRLTQSPLLDAFRPSGDTFMTEGKSIVVKSSGSGMPDHWIRALKQALPPQTAIHIPHGHPAKDIQNFFEDLGGNTRLIIAHPSEVVQVVSAMRDRRVDTHFVVLPPRGAHELQNLIAARDWGLVTAIVDFKDGSNPAIDELASLQRVSVTNLTKILDADLPSVDTRTFLGSEDIFAKNFSQ